jgi:RNA polymerase sigma-70 factor, ECF subfamily
VIRDQSDQRTELERLAPELRRFARALVARDSDDPANDADALTRDTLARATRAERQGRARDPRVWLRATLMGLNRSRLKARGSAAPMAGSAGPGVTDALGALPLDQREALLLVVLEGFSYAEAADALCVPRVAVGARVARARLALETLLDGASPSDGRGKPRHPPHLRVIK